MKVKNSSKILSVVLAVIMIVSMFAVSFPVMADITKDETSCTYDWDFANSGSDEMADELLKNSTKITNFDSGNLDGFFGYEDVTDKAGNELGSLGIKIDSTATLHGVVLNTPEGMQGVDYTLSGGATEGEFQEQWNPGVIFAKDDGGYYAYRFQYVEGRFVRALYYLKPNNSGAFDIKSLFSDSQYAGTGPSVWLNGEEELGYISSVDLGSRSWVSNENGVEVGHDRVLNTYFKTHYSVTDSDGTITVSAQLEYIGGYTTQPITIAAGDTLSVADLVIEKSSVGSTTLKPEEADTEGAATYSSKLGTSHNFSGFTAAFGFFNNNGKVRETTYSNTQIYSVLANYEKTVGCAHTPELRESTVVEQTCEGKGYTGDYYCTKCGELITKGSETPALGHKYVETERVPATIEAEGYYIETCSRCGDKQRYVLDPLEPFTVVFYDADGNEYDTQTVGFGLSATEPKTPAAPDDTMRFVGWDTDFSYITEDLDVYPVFEEIQDGDTVVYDWDFTDTDNGKATTTIMNAHSKRVAQFAPASAQDKYHRYNEELGAYEINTVMTNQVPNSFRAVIIDTPAMKKGTYFKLEGASLPSDTFEAWHPGVIFAKDDNGYYGYRFQFDQGKFVRKLSYFRKNSNGGYDITSILSDNKYNSDLTKFPVLSIDGEEVGNLTSQDFGSSNSYAAGWNKLFKSGYEVTEDDGIITIKSWVEYIGESPKSGNYMLTAGTTISPRDIVIDTKNPGEAVVNPDTGVTLNDNGDDMTFNDKLSGKTSFSRFKTTFGFYHDPGNQTFGTNTNEQYWATQIYNVSAEYNKVDECDHDPDYYYVDGYKYDCEEGGETGKTICGACGTVMKESEPLAPRGKHVWTLVSEEETGKNYKCSVCGKEEFRPNCEHEFGDGVVTPNTCTEGGYTTYTCKKCGFQKKDNFTPALGHDEIVNETKPTCTKDGQRVTTCSRCNYRNVEVLKATGHSFTEWEVVREPSKDEDGLKTRKCTTCGEVEEEAIPYYGDVNGDGVVDINDAILVAQADVGNTTIASDRIAAADVNGDGNVTIHDALLIARFVAKLIDKLPIK